ncbi:MAG: ABC transporter ATP-binding protein, partial [Roseiflexaceae bacterium]
MKNIRRMLAQLTPYWGLFVGAWLSLILASVGNLYSPLVLRDILDTGIMKQSWPPILTGVIWLLVLAIVRGITSFTQSYWVEQVSQSYAFDIRNSLFEKIQSLSFAYHDRTQAGQLMTRLTSDVEQVRTFIAGGLMQFVGAVIMIIGSLVALFSMNWQLTLVAVLFIPPSMVVLGYFMRVVRPMWEEIQQRLGVLNVVLQENISGVRLVKAFGRESYEQARFASKNDALLDMNLQSVKAMASSFPLIFLINNLGTLMIIWVGGYQVMNDQLSVGELIAFNTFLTLLFQPIFMLGMIAAQISRATVSNDRIIELLDTQNDVPEAPDAITLPPIVGHVSFQHVSLRYA